MKFFYSWLSGLAFTGLPDNQHAIFCTDAPFAEKII